MHAAAVAVLCWATAAASFLGGSGGVLLAVLLALLVATLGLPHGAADHRAARRILEPRLGWAWAPWFVLVYGGVAVAMIASWFAFPLVTIVAFFLASAWHFGIEEPRPAIAEPWARACLRLARGGLVLWLPLACHGREVAEALSVITPSDASVAVTSAVALLRVIAYGMLPLAATGLGLQIARAARRRGRTRRVLAIDCLLLASLATLFVIANPLVGFLVYFCAWHSARGLRRLRRVFGEGWMSLARGLAPTTLLAILLIGVGAWFIWWSPGIESVLLRSTFLGLSAVAAPHMLLHGLGGWIERHNRPRQQRPAPAADYGAAAAGSVA